MNIKPKAPHRDNRVTAKIISNDVTIVTAYFDIGTVDGASKHQRKEYAEWAAGFKWIKNPVYAFFNAEEDATTFRHIRKTQPSTQIRKVHRNEIWAFSLHEAIKLIFMRRGYTPLRATAKANYSSVMNSKYDFIEIAIRENPFQTKYFCWMDYGYLRRLKRTSNSSMVAHLPPRFNKSRVAYSAYPSRSKHLKYPFSAQQVIGERRFWVSGGFFIGSTDVLKQMIEQYKHTILALIKLGWMGTDENALFYMLQPNNNITRTVDIQAYHGKGKSFHMGFLCLRQVRGTKLVWLKFSSKINKAKLL